MTVTAKLYAGFLKSLFNKEVDLDTDVLKVMLCTSSYVPSQAHQYKSSVTNEVTGTNYTAGGKTLTGVTVTLTGNTITLDADDVTWAASTITNAATAVFYSTATNNPLIAYWDLGQNFSSNAGDFTLNNNASGIASLSVA